MSASVLIVEDDRELRTAVARDLESQGFVVVTAGDYEDAVEHLDAQSVDVVLTDLRLGGRDGIDLLEYLVERAPNVRPVLMSAYATARDHQTATRLGAVQVLCKPFSRQELLDAINQAAECDTGFHGRVHGLSLADVLQMFHYARRSVTVVVEGDVRGTIHIADGEIVHATCGDTIGIDALAAILERPSGTIRTSALQDETRTIDISFGNLLLDVMRAIDEQTAAPASSPASDASSDDIPLVPIEDEEDDDDAFDLEIEIAEPEHEQGDATKWRISFDDSPAEPLPTAPRQPDPTSEDIDVDADPIEPERQTVPSGISSDEPARPSPGEERNMSLDRAINNAQKEIPECVAVGVVEMQTGMLLGVKTVDSHPQEVLDLVAAATGDLFQGRNVAEIERLFRKARGVSEDTDHHYFQEIIILSENLLHVFQRCKRNADVVVVSVCRIGANLGMVIARSRGQLSKIEANI